jgi:chemotaxis protein CheY-P-specific phosphatase CheC
MGKEFEAILSDVAMDTLEQLAFVFASSNDDEDLTNEAPWIAAKVAFEGPFKGRLFMKTSNRVVDEITANMLGIDENEEVSSDQRCDAFKETINVICGNILPEIADKKAVFNIEAPEVLTDAGDIETALKDQGSPAAVVTLDIDDEACDLYLFMDEP